MKMECPICGAKMLDGKLCKYCGITNVQVETASNEKAKQYLKAGKKEDVCYSKTMPADVNKTKLVLLTVFLGYAGAGNFYVGKKVKAWFNLVSTVLSFIFGLLVYLSETFEWLYQAVIFNLCLDFLSIFGAISFLMWFFDIMALIFKTYKVPVVLGEDEVKVKVKATRRKVWKQL